MNLSEVFFNHISSVIDHEGVYPHVVISLEQDDKMTVNALDLNPNQVMNFVVKTLLNKDTKELIYGLDRICQAGQGTELKDAVVGAYWNGEYWKAFVVEYQHNPREVQPMDWDNKFWTDAVKKEVKSFMADVFG